MNNYKSRLVFISLKRYTDSSGVIGYFILNLYI